MSLLRTDLLPEPVLNAIRASRAGWRMATASGRVLPAVVLSGVQKGGTTSVYHQLRAHPNVLWVGSKGTHYFDLHWDRGPRWYRSCFPHRVQLGLCRLRASGSVVTAESCGYYFDHPLAPARCARTLPESMIVIMLRNPIERAHSAYHDAVRKGRESLSFEEAIDAEDARLAGEVERLVSEPGYYSSAHRHLSYLSRGVYADHVARWLEVFPREQVLVMQSERFYADMASGYAGLLEFLGLPDWRPGQFEKQNAARYGEMASSTRERLTAYFAPKNQRLYDLLGVDFGWD